jgi:hypothetical protein
LRGHQFVARYTEGFSHFVASMTAPVASGWSGGRVGPAPTGKRRLSTAHTQSGPIRSIVDLTDAELAALATEPADEGEVLRK